MQKSKPRKYQLLIDGELKNLCCICRQIVKRGTKSCVKCKPQVSKMWSMMGAARKRATRKNIEIDITIDDLFSLYVEHCPIFKTKLNWNNKKPQDDSPSLDRVDVERGYIKNNIAIISMRANRIKDDATLSELKTIINWMERKIGQK